MSSNHNLKKSDHRVADLDGVRAIAIWMVLLLHVLFAFPNVPGALAFIPSPILLVLSHGWLGVDLFFMLSGFLITGILLGSKYRSHYFSEFLHPTGTTHHASVFCDGHSVVNSLPGLRPIFLVEFRFRRKSVAIIPRSCAAWTRGNVVAGD